MLVPPPGTIKSKKINNISKIDTCRYRESAPALVVIEGASQPKALLMISDDNAMPFQEMQALLLALP